MCWFVNCFSIEMWMPQEWLEEWIQQCFFSKIHQSNKYVITVSVYWIPESYMYDKIFAVIQNCSIFISWLKHSPTKIRQAQMVYHNQISRLFQRINMSDQLPFNTLIYTLKLFIIFLSNRLNHILSGSFPIYSSLSTLTSSTQCTTRWSLLLTIPS